MNEEFVKANCQTAEYTLKAGTKSSYYWAGGFSELPNRLSISRDTELTKVSRKGRNLLHPIVGQMIGSFTQKEVSRYKEYYPYVCRTQIWNVAEYPLLLGYGTIGITNQEGKVEDTGDLLVFYTPDNWTTIKIFLFAGMGNPDDMAEAMEYANQLREQP